MRLPLWGPWGRAAPKARVPLGGAQRAPSVCFANPLLRLIAPRGNHCALPSFAALNCDPTRTSPHRIATAAIFFGSFFCWQKKEHLSGGCRSSFSQAAHQSHLRWQSCRSSVSSPARSTAGQTPGGKAAAGRRTRRYNTVHRGCGRSCSQGSRHARQTPAQGPQCPAPVPRPRQRSPAVRRG